MTTEHKKLYYFQSRMGGHCVAVEDWSAESAYEQVKDYVITPILKDIVDIIKEVKL